MDLSQEVPEPKKKKNNEDGNPLTFHEIVAKLGLNGIPPREVAKMTMKQVHYAIQEIVDDRLFNAKIAGCEVEDDQDIKELTVQDLPGLMSMLGG